MALLGLSVAKTAGQEYASDPLYKSLEGAPGVTIVSVSEDIVRAIDLVMDDEEDQLIDKIDRFRLVSCRKEKGAKAAERVHETFSQKPFEPASYNQNDGRVFVVRTGRTIHEFHVLRSGSQELILLSFYGEFREADIKKLIKDVDDVR